MEEEKRGYGGGRGTHARDHRDRSDRRDDFSSRRGYSGRDSHRDSAQSHSRHFGQSHASSAMAPGGAVPLYANYFKIKIKNNQKIFVYSSKFEGADIQATNPRHTKRVYRQLSQTLKADFGPIFEAYCDKIYALVNVAEQKVYNHILRRGGEVKLTVTFDQILDLDEVSGQNKAMLLDLCMMAENAFRNYLEEFGCKQIGRLPKFYDVANKVRINSQVVHLEAWPGYHNDVRATAQSLFLNCDSCTKFVDYRTIFDNFNEHVGQNRRSEDFFKKFDSSDTSQPRVTVITSHGAQKSYQVDAMIASTPQELTFTGKDGNSMTVLEYFRRAYNIDLVKTQPVLVINRNDGKIYLPTQVCHMAQLPADFTQDPQKVKAIQRYKILEPKVRKQKISEFMSRFIRQQNHIENTMFEVEPNMVELKGRILDKPMIKDSTGQSRPFQDYTGRRVAHLESLKLKNSNWGFVYKVEHTNLVNQIIDKMRGAGRALGIEIDNQEPIWVEIPRERDLIADGVAPEELRNGGAYIHCIKHDLGMQAAKKVSLLFVLLDNDKHHPFIKSFLNKAGIVSQCLLFKNISSKINEVSVHGNVLKQCSAKADKDLYAINLPSQLRNIPTMIIGLDVVNMGRNCMIGMAASFNQGATKYFSKVFLQDLHRHNQNLSKNEQDGLICRERSEQLKNFITQALENFANKNNGTLPKLIVIYRDGVGGPTFEPFVVQNEGPNSALHQAIKGFAPDFNPKIILCLINKKSLTRFFLKNNGDVSNPMPGTVVDTTIVENDGSSSSASSPQVSSNPATSFDFFLVANNNPRSASALPVYYKIVMNTSPLSKREIEELTYSQCYAYFGFGGPIKVPAAVKYAEKKAQ